MAGFAGKNSNKMWVSLMTTLGISAAMFMLKRYQNGKILQPIENMMGKMNPNGMMAGSNPLTEFSNEIATNMLSKSEQNK